MSSFAMVDPGLFGLSLFRPLPRRNRDAARLHSVDTQAVHAGRRLRVASMYVLGADDLAVLLAVLALAGLLGKKLEAGSSEADRVAVVDGLRSRGDLVEAVHVRVVTTMYAVCREAGLMKNGQAYERISESLWRMNQIGYGDLGAEGANARRSRASGSQRLLSYDIDDASGELEVVVNARFAAVLLGGQFVRVNLAESRALGEMGRLLHLRLSVLVREGGTMTVPMDQLGEWIYGCLAKSGREAVERRKEVRNGLTQLAALDGWTIDENRRRLMVSVNRPTRGISRPVLDAAPERCAAQGTSEA